MGSSIARYFLGNELLAESKVQAPYGTPSSLVFFCRTCGEIWARVWVEGEKWHIVPHPCEQHEWTGIMDYGAVSGSMIIGSMLNEGYWAWAACIEYLPLAVMKRELEVHLRMKEKEIGNDVYRDDSITSNSTNNHINTNTSSTVCKG